MHYTARFTVAFCVHAPLLPEQTLAVFEDTTSKKCTHAQLVFSRFAFVLKEQFRLLTHGRVKVGKLKI
jgi:hypothetical protein